MIGGVLRARMSARACMAIIALIHTAYGGAHNFHDSNRITFHPIGDFRRRVKVLETGSLS